MPPPAPTAAADPPDRPARALALMLAALFVLGFQDSLVRLVGHDTSLWQFQGLRAAMTLMLVIAAARLLAPGRLSWPRRPGAVALRSVLLVGAMIGFFGGVPELTLTQMAAGLYTFPLFVTVLAGLVLGERVGPQRRGAVALGALGTALILQPWDAGFRWLQVLPVGAGLCYAGMILVTRRACRGESPLTLVAALALAFLCASLAGLAAVALLDPGPETVAALPYLATGWQAIGQEVLVVIAVCAVLNLGCNMALATAYQTAESSWLAPFDYSYFLFAAFWGYVFFHDVPDAVSTAGMALIAAAGLWTARRERRLAGR